MDNVKQGNKYYKRKKRLIKFGFYILFTILVIGNVYTAWALPKFEVDCCVDSVFEFFNKQFQEYKSFKLNPVFMSYISIYGDIIFVISMIKWVLLRGDLLYIKKLMVILMTKIIVDILFFQNNFYLENLNFIQNLPKTILSTFNTHNSLLNLNITMQCFCFLYEIKENKYKILLFILSFNLAFSIVFYLFSNFIFSFQILFSYIIVDYINTILT
jgi:hypothetical protein